MKATPAACLALALFAGCGGNSKSGPTQTLAPAKQGANPLGIKPIETGHAANKEATEEAGKKAEESKEASEAAGKKAKEAKEASDEGAKKRARRPAVNPQVVSGPFGRGV